MTDSTPLQLEHIRVAFGGNIVLEDLTMSFGAGFNGLVGPNGAGKTTAFNVICGYVVAQQGTIRMKGREITRPTPAAMSKAGVGRTFQAPRLVLEMPVLENVMLGRHNRVGARHVAEVLNLPSARRAEEAAREESLELLGRFGLAHRAGQAAHSVPLGSQKLIEICRAMASNPSVLLLDEPAAGLGADDVDRMVSGLRALQEERDLCVVMIEHDMHLVQRLCPHIGVLHFGRIIADGAPADVVRDPVVIEAYLGAGVATAS